MIGDVVVKFTITGANGWSVTLSREEAEHLKKQLNIALRKTGKPQQQTIAPIPPGVYVTKELEKAVGK